VYNRQQRIRKAAVACDETVVSGLYTEGLLMKLVCGEGLTLLLLDSIAGWKLVEI